MSMRQFLCRAILVLASGPWSAWAQAPQLVAETEPLSAEEQLQKFHLPPGFRIELIAAEPDCRKPMNLKFDAAGRLWYTQSIEYPWPVPEGQTGRDTIRVMTDSNNDGIPDQTQIYATGLNIPIGLTPVHDGLLGYSIPQLWHFQDTNGDLQADHRTERYGTFGFRDTHGMCSSLNWWIDGWVYGCHGFSNESKVQGADGRPIILQSGNTYRLRPDGSHIEYISHGQVNPFGMCFDRFGNQFTSDCHTKPAYVILRGAYYPSFGKPHDGLGYGPELLQHLHGSTGIAGIVHYSATHFPEEFHENLFIGNPVTGRINRDTIEFHGSSLKAVEQADFLSCDDPWFRPVDLQLAPDGSLYIADFYNRIIGHYEVPLTHPGRDRERGRIWRVSYVGTDQPVVAPRIPDLTKATIPQLIGFLAHEHLSVRVLATHQLVHRHAQAAVPALEIAAAGEAPSQRAHALWALERLGALSNARWTIAAADPAALVRVHAVKILAEREEWSLEQREQLTTRLLSDAEPLVVRAAVEALGRHPRPECLQQIIAVWDRTPAMDTYLIHTAKIALRDALVRLHDFDQIPRENWTAAERRRLLTVLPGAPLAPAAELALRMVSSEPWPEGQAAALAQFTARYAEQAPAEAWPTIAKQGRSYPRATQFAILRGTSRGHQERGTAWDTACQSWAMELVNRVTTSSPTQQIVDAAAFCRDVKLLSAGPTLHSWLQDPNLRTGEATAYLATLEALASLGHPDAVTLTLATVRDDTLTDVVRGSAAQFLGGISDDRGRQGLVQSLATASSTLALQISRGLTQTPAGGEMLLTAIQQGKASARLLQDSTVVQRLRIARLPELEQRREQLLEGLPPEDQALSTLIAERKQKFQAAQPDVQRGRLAFEKACIACHKIGDRGAKVGPELDGVGLRGLDRLLEDTLAPSRNVDAAFRATALVLKDGRVITGLVAREEGATLVLVNEQGRDVTISSNDIEERQQLRLSPMPANVTEKLSLDEYCDLLHYLLSQRVIAQPAR